jgi:hypothetical protein
VRFIKRRDRMLMVYAPERLVWDDAALPSDLVDV